MYMYIWGAEPHALFVVVRSIRNGHKHHFPINIIVMHEETPIDTGACVDLARM